MYEPQSACVMEHNGTFMYSVNATTMDLISWACDATCTNRTVAMEMPTGMCFQDMEGHWLIADVNRNLVTDLSNQTYIGASDIINIMYTFANCSDVPVHADVLFTSTFCYDTSRLQCASVCNLQYQSGCTQTFNGTCGTCTGNVAPVPAMCIPDPNSNMTVYTIAKCGAWGYNCSDITTTTTTTGAATTTAHATTTGAATTTAHATTTGAATSTTTSGQALTTTTGAASAVFPAISAVVAVAIAVFAL